MKQSSTKQKMVNRVDAKGSAPAANEQKNDNTKSKLTMADLKGKKVDGDPALASDQPVKQVN